MKVLILFAALLCMSCLQAEQLPRTPEGRPDLTGTYDVATLTPLERPKAYGDRLYLSPEQARKIADDVAALKRAGDQISDPTRSAPPAGGDGSAGAAGNVGGYNSFWIDNGDQAASLGGSFRTSIIIDPPNGRRPPMTAQGSRRMAEFFSLFGKNTGAAWWLDRPGPGPYDNMEMRPNGERCLLSFGSTSGPPMLPALYNNMKRIVQTNDTVMIMAEMIHDARVVRLNSKHPPEHIRYWMGDSIGFWEGDTLVVDTRNFRERPALYGADANLHVVEKFTLLADGNLHYQFTVDNPTVWQSSWSGEYPWPASSDKVYEYACHEGNYALGNILRGARLLEQDAQALVADPSG
ncbi:MAG: hypothetical protein HN856_17185 [Gammaproteobacteria bacterium]|jgi:hypothetical protein|nr:hypothetical protein [Gammaproteobacteria bacterium]